MSSCAPDQIFLQGSGGRPCLICFPPCTRLDRPRHVSFQPRNPPAPTQGHCLRRFSWGHRLLLLLILLITWMSVASAASRTRGPTLRASSSLMKDGKHGPERAFDGDLSTTWVEGASGAGIGEWLEVNFRRYERLSSISVFGGDYQDARRFMEGNHLAEATLTLWTRQGVKERVLTFPDRFEPAVIAVGLEVRRVRLRITRTYAGELTSDTPIAEVAFNFRVKDPSVIGALSAWRESGPGKKALLADQEALATAVRTVQGGELTGLAPLLEAARLGPLPIRQQLEKLTRPGFSLAYLKPDMGAIEYLKTLSLPEGAPAVEQAIWVANEIDAVYLRRVATYLRATGQLRRPPRTGLPVWGTRGIEPGAFQSRGEPLSLTVSSEGDIYVADVGNNRIQRFSERGKFKGTSASGGPVVEEYFIGTQVPHYVAGAASGTEKGQLTQPLAITMVSRGRTELVATVDASRRLSLFDTDLHHIRSWDGPPKAPLLSGVGLAGPALVGLRGRLYLLWDDQGYVYTLDGTLEARFSLEARVKSAVAIGRKLLINFEGGEVIRHGYDGLRLNLLLSLPEADGSEDIDLFVGKDGDLYVHSDAGRLYHYSKRGKLLGSRNTFDKPAFPYRLAIGYGRAYISSRDQLHPFDLP